MTNEEAFAAILRSAYGQDAAAAVLEIAVIAEQQILNAKQQEMVAG